MLKNIDFVNFFGGTLFEPEVSFVTPEVGIITGYMSHVTFSINFEEKSNFCQKYQFCKFFFGNFEGMKKYLNVHFR